MTLVTSIAVAAPGVLVAALMISSCLQLLKNYAAARSMGVPIRIVPISPLNPFWALVDRRVLGFIRRRMPFSNNSFTKYNWRGWEVADRYESHQEMGDIWVLVTPFKNWVYVNDPNALLSLFKRGTEFPRPVFITEVLNVFGPNISTAEGARWKTQRRIATHCFNEQNNEIVWAESTRLASDMLKYWTSRPSIASSAEDLRTLSLLVLSRAGFGKSFDFKGHEEQASSNPSSNYKESLQTVLENLVLILGFGTKFLSNPWLPRKFRLVHEACAAFQTYMTNLYEEEKKAYKEGKLTDNNLMSLLIHASQQDSEESGSGSPGGLTESEIYGNMFAFNFAGHDTTSHTFTFALYFLASNPDIQDWISEEVCHVVGGKQPHEWDYRQVFPRLKRCLAVLYETLRLYTVVPPIKWTANESQELVVGGKTILLPPNSMIAPSYGSVQTDPRFWGPDSLTWKPSRWIKSNAPGLENEEFDLHTRGAFVSWSMGARDCPGKKLSQVEFVATMATLFRDWRVTPERKKGENLDAACKRVLNLIEADSGYVLLLQMLHPEKAPLVWTQK
ncbi:cytochrome P450 [Stachybotrys elegans]|uniref:Cytochrome P450 n=1 Tax=Stachybotrys elegans TaxID=80388 RepID=A0A8K0SCP3_9HYPO|nr:cytochrome P450 [Stachybotrys elegans]